MSKFQCITVLVLMALMCVGMGLSIRSCTDDLVARRTFVAEQCQDVVDYRDCKLRAFDTFHRMSLGEQ